MEKRNKSKMIGIYNKIIIHKKISLSIIHIGRNLKNTLEKAVSHNIEGKCIIEGYVKPKSVKILTYSSGVLNSHNVIYDVVLECLICSPVEGQIINCVIKNITETAGIKAEIDDNPSPLIIYLARDHHYNVPEFNKLNIDEKINVKVIGQRYELNDKYVSIIAELITK
jgi:DNA-directed RNA polymerase subunit E'/Rpb7